uniref:dTDP-D-glucose 4,6-dehydratase n=1 Tax=Parastrongyloides trichosuri TaxID=131310 RepID=A0A0N5A393_PARTI
MTKLNYIPKNVMVTGGCGFIGANFVNYIFKTWSDIKIVNVDKLILNSDIHYVNEEVQNSGRYHLITTDIKNETVIKKTLKEHDIDTIIHFAADCTSTRCYAQPTEAIENNVISFVMFADAVRSYGKVKKFIYISTDEVYGDSDLSKEENGKKETSVQLPGNPYAATKSACEMYVQIYLQTYKMPIVLLRINNIYGPNQWDVKIVPRFITLAINKEKFTIQGAGHQLRSWLFVDDAADGIVKATERGVVGEIYNLGTYFEKNVIELAYTIQKEVDRQLNREETPVQFISIPDRPYNDLRYLIDITKAKKELGWEPKTEFEDGMRYVISSHIKGLKRSAKMNVVIYGGKGWVGLQFQEYFKNKQIPFALASKKPGFDSDADVFDELLSLHPTHVLCSTGRTHGGTYKTIEYLEGGPEKTYENVRDNMYSVISLAEICKKESIHFTYIGTGYLFAYDEKHPIGGDGFKDDDLPTFFGNSYSVVKGYTDRMISSYENSEIINARITLPLNYNMDEDRNLLTKITKYNQIFDLPVSITIMPDCIPAIVSLMEKRFGGNLNLVNPGPISLHEILQLYKTYVDKDLPEYDVITKDSKKGQELLKTKGNCALDTEKLKKYYPQIMTARESLIENFKKMASK